MEKENKKGILNHYMTKKVARNVSLAEIIDNKTLYDYYRKSDHSETTGFVMEITDIESEDVKQILAEHKIEVGDIIYFDIKEYDDSKKKYNDLRTKALYTAQEVIMNKEDYKGLKDTATFFHTQNHLWTMK